VAVTEGSRIENVNKTGVRLWTGCSLETLGALRTLGVVVDAATPAYIRGAILEGDVFTSTTINPMGRV
jgi:hypothetical protein